jgi:hypothetical protein
MVVAQSDNHRGARKKEQATENTHAPHHQGTRVASVTLAKIHTSLQIGRTESRRHYRLDKKRQQ